MADEIKTPTSAAPAAKVDLEQIKQMLKDVEDLKNKVAAKAAAPAKETLSPKPMQIDWSKITEADIANLDVPIPVYEQESPEYLTVHLKDKSYVPRWIHVLPERLGVCLATGYSYVEKEDLDSNYPHPLNFDQNGKYTHGDVVCLKIQKERYFGAIRRNYLKTMAIHGKQQVRQRAMQAIENESPQIADAIHRGAMTLYEPGDMKGMEVSPEVFSKNL